MIVDRGAVAAALERWNARRRQIFYPKTDFESEITALRRRKEQLTAVDPARLANILDEEISSIEFLPNAGTFHALFRVTTPSKRYILKLALENEAGEFAIESSLVKTLKQAGVPVAHIRAFNILTGQLPSPFLIADEASGRSLSSFENVDTQAVPEPILFELGKCVARIHQIEGKGAGFLDACSLSERIVGLFPDWPAYITMHLEAHIKVCGALGAIAPHEHTLIKEHFANAAAPLGRAPLRLLHGDLGNHNVFSDGQKITAVLDWEDALIGDPVFDIAYWGTFVRDEMRQRFIDGYQTVEKLPPDFEHLYWLYYLRIAISKTVHRHRFETKDRPGRPPASQRIQKALSNLAKL